MILARAPLRVSLAGGGTDLPAFYSKHGGHILSFAINRYVYIALNAKFDGSVRMSYSETENVDHVSQLQHALARAVLTELGIERGIEIVSVSDVPSTGTGLGASAAYLAALIRATHKFLGTTDDPSLIADLGFRIEAEELGHPVGRQDHLATAHGGINEFIIATDGSSTVLPVKINDSIAEMLERNTVLVYTGRGRPASSILSKLKSSMEGQGSAINGAQQLAGLVGEVRTALQNQDINALGQLLDASWKIKRGLAAGVSHPEIDLLYDTAMGAGALGGKVTGAGGGGFLFLVVPEERRSAVVDSLVGKTVLDFQLAGDGAAVMFSSNH